MESFKDVMERVKVGLITGEEANSYYYKLYREIRELVEAGLISEEEAKAKLSRH